MVRSEMVATVWKVAVQKDQEVSEGDTLVILESMKMEIPVFAPADGRVAAVHVEDGATVRDGQMLVTLAVSGHGSDGTPDVE